MGRARMRTAEVGCGRRWPPDDHHLVEAGKRTLVYFAPSKDFHVLANEEDLRLLFTRCEQRLAFPAALASRWMPGLFPEVT